MLRKGLVNGLPLFSYPIGFKTKPNAQINTQSGTNAFRTFVATLNGYEGSSL